ncbi:MULTISPECIES: four helix bundle protein [unclassified Vibrio]|uniref:four helix bundle protein n=1 Tax=unclassified Vibrio TaxID=2614977 RepID=UPI0014834543|nr:MULTISPECIES: four helix bundle protein [unclassified Vibrio]NNN45435.1 four helix bundle protein [Vibrio sp. 1-1(7)]NNN73281.1 four helix bundle protein [Vibrio sp. 12-2(3-a)]
MRQLNFEKLEVWKRSCRLSCDLYLLLDTCKNYGFKDQITRSALSIASNIAEGEERETAKESARFLYIAKGSAGEAITQLYIGIEAGFLDKQKGLALLNEAKEISAMLASLIKIRKGYVREDSAEYLGKAGPR